MPEIPRKSKSGSKILRDFIARNHPVIKRNDLIQNTRFNLTANEQKLILHLIQRIGPKTKSLTFKLDVHKYAHFIGVKDNRMNVRRIKRDLKKLNDKSFWLKMPPVNGQPHEQLVHWFGLIDHNQATGIFTLRFDDRLKPFLLKTKQFFTKYNYYYIMDMRSKYSIRLYELFASYYSAQNNRRGFDYTLSEILHTLDLDKIKSYHRFYCLNNRVIKPAVKEINQFSDLHVRVKRLKKGHSVYGINVLLSKKTKKELYNTQNTIQKDLMRHKTYPKK